MIQTLNLKLTSNNPNNQQKYIAQFNRHGGVIWHENHIEFSLAFEFLNMLTEDIIDPLDPDMIKNKELHEEIMAIINTDSMNLSENLSDKELEVVQDIYEEFSEVVMNIEYERYLEWTQTPEGKQYLELTQPLDNKFKILNSAIDPILEALDDIQSLLYTKTNEFQLKQILHKIPKLFVTHNMALDEYQIEEYKLQDVISKS